MIPHIGLVVHHTCPSATCFNAGYHVPPVFALQHRYLASFPLVDSDNHPACPISTSLIYETTDPSRLDDRRGLRQIDPDRSTTPGSGPAEVRYLRRRPARKAVKPSLNREPTGIRELYGMNPLGTLLPVAWWIPASVVTVNDGPGRPHDKKRTAELELDMHGGTWAWAAAFGNGLR